MAASSPESNLGTPLASGYAIPVERSHGALHAVSVCGMPCLASSLRNVRYQPALTVGIDDAADMSPWYAKSAIGRTVPEGTTRDGSLVTSW